MQILTKSLDDEPKLTLAFPDSNGREVCAFALRYVQCVGTHYPSIRLLTDSGIINPIREQIMSMPDMVDSSISAKPMKRHETYPVFFFVYNVENYYHFVYDTLPYLMTYHALKQVVPSLRLLIGLAPQQDYLYRFVTEFLEILGINESEVLFVDEETVYDQMFIANSYTHDGASNSPPRQEIYGLYQKMATDTWTHNLTPRKIYVSRRSHMHGQNSNMGTDYTSRRLCINEAEIVDYLLEKDYVEVFTELLSTRDKIAMFKNATHVVGPIGGGLCNVLFSRPTTKLFSIISPGFWKINSRFGYSFSGVLHTPFEITRHIETGKFKTYMRVRLQSGAIGEINQIDGNRLGVLCSTEPVAGWNSRAKYEQIWVQDHEVEPVDDGLNSPWEVDLKSFKEFIDVVG